MLRSPDEETLDQYMRQLRSRPLLTPAQVNDLARARDRGDRRAVAMLVEHNMLLVVSLAARHRGQMPLLEAIQEGSLGLMRAAEKFNPDLGYMFSTYATWWIHQTIDRARPRYQPGMQVAPARAADLRRLRQEIARREADNLPAPTVQETAQMLGLGETVAEALLRLTKGVARLDAADPEGHELRERVSTEEEPVEESVERSLMAEQIRSMLSELTDHQREVLELRFGLTGQPPMTLHAIGERFHLSKESIRQVEALALRSLRARADVALAV